MTDLARQHAVDVCRDLRLSADKILGAFDLVESALGIEWLAEQERQAEQHRIKISDAHTLVRLLATPTHEAHAEICELALYLQTFAGDPAMPSIVKDLRTPKYSAVLMELAFAYRWRDAGADVRLRPPTARGEADFEANLGQLPYIAECSLFPNEIFKEIRFRLPQIVAEAVDKAAFKIPVKVFVTIRTYPPGNVEAQIYELVNRACRQLGVAASAAVNRELDFATARVEVISPEPEYNPFLREAEEEPWDICIRHTQHTLRRDEPIYRAIDQAPVEEIARIFVKFPANDINAYEAIYKKLKKEAAQLSGVKGPRVVILDIGARGDLKSYDEQVLRSQLDRVMRAIPELACVWLCMRKFLREYRHRYFSLYVPNPESIYQLPASFVQRSAMREWRWDHLAAEEFKDS